ncbi:LysM peptidoglycan-binding domain-containing protein [Jeotgalibaca sp. MA1X17-3]|uniref:3D domain-containing protein n=1 Tax=Jeotgalibaca sp. MA1X17-3 TaxID=2908211 RepID=UPI001EEC6E7E|nr:3D domain-containing protein [Jeotgalibaca sp. MA1X17-3]UJF16398.1 LysM peptidoglycan-binding domain-containing protein [Jeotgalibaca sp. MA1X17-3]
MNIKNRILVTGASIALTGMMAFSNPTETKAAELTPETWTARTVLEVKNDLKQNEKGSKYTFQWGDTLSAIANATDISVNALVEVNNISNADFIMAGRSIYLSTDNKVVTLGEGESVKSYDVSQDEVVEVETPVETIEEYNAIEEVKETEPVVEEAPAAKTPVVEETPAATSEGYTVNVEATAYSTNQPALSDYTFSGINLRENPNVIAVDPNFIPLGSTIIVPGYGTYIAGDTGSAIIGNRIDIHITNLDTAWAFGRQNMSVTVIPNN